MNKKTGLVKGKALQRVFKESGLNYLWEDMVAMDLLNGGPSVRVLPWEEGFLVIGTDAATVKEIGSRLQSGANFGLRYCTTPPIEKWENAFWRSRLVAGTPKRLSLKG